MLTLSLDELFGPEIVAAFQKQWSAQPDAALAQAEKAVRTIVEPRNSRERFLANFVVALVGPEPDGLAWLEALAVGSFKLRDNVTYAIGRVGESPAKFIDRQRQRIRELADHPKARGREEDYRNAYNDALRLIVATTLLTQLRTGVAAKAAIGAGWPLMAAVSQHFTADEKRALFWFGNSADLQEGLAERGREALHSFLESTTDDWPSRADFDRDLPPGTDLNDFFRPERKTEIAVKLSPASRREMAIDTPKFVRDADPACLDLASRHRAEWRAQILLSALLNASSAMAIIGLATRAEKRHKMRESWCSGASSLMPPNYHVECAIARHIGSGGFMPPDTPIEYASFIEEEAAFSFQSFGKKWSGLDIWRKAGFFDFKESDDGTGSYLTDLEV